MVDGVATPMEERRGVASRSLSPSITWLIVYRGVLMDTNGRNDFLFLISIKFLPFLSAVDKEISQVYVNTDLLLLRRRRTANLVW